MFSGTLEVHPHQEFHFANDTVSKGCCFCWKAKPKKVKEYTIDKSGTFKPINGTTMKVEERIIANERLAKIVQDKFNPDPIENNKAFDRLRKKINHDFENDRITEERLIQIISAIYEVKKEINE